jgi:hypothetical protein
MVAFMKIVLVIETPLAVQSVKYAEFVTFASTPK